MTVKSLLNLSSATKVDIITKDFYQYRIDYLKEYGIVKYGSFEVHSSAAFIPEEILKSKVKHIDTNSVTGALSIFLK